MQFLSSQSSPVRPIRTTILAKVTVCNLGKFNYSSAFGRGLAIASLNMKSLLSHIDELQEKMVSCELRILF